MFVDQEDFDFKVGLLQEFWDRRNKELVPARKGEGFGLRKQKFMVMYNLMARYTGDKYTINNMKAFENGPIYYDIFSHIKRTGENLEERERHTQEYNQNIIDAVTVMIETESVVRLSKLTHSFNFWQSNFDPSYDECNLFSEETDNNILEDDITDKDSKNIGVLLRYYTFINDNYKIDSNNGTPIAIEKKYCNEIMEIIKDQKINEEVYKAIEYYKELGIMVKLEYNDEYSDDLLGGIIIDI